jgi:hypothetical protein
LGLWPITPILSGVSSLISTRINCLRISPSSKVIRRGAMGSWWGAHESKRNKHAHIIAPPAPYCSISSHYMYRLCMRMLELTTCTIYIFSFIFLRQGPRSLFTPNQYKRKEVQKYGITCKFEIRAYAEHRVCSCIWHAIIWCMVGHRMCIAYGRCSCSCLSVLVYEIAHHECESSLRSRVNNHGMRLQCI